jgi:ABC-type antimicrobial peptide transport system permease subunit
MQASIAAAVHSVDPQIALAQPETMDQIRSESLADERFTLTLFSTFALGVLFLSALGIYGVMAFSVAQRSHEIALRMALVVREGAGLALVGRELGGGGTYFVGRAM